MKVSLNTIKRFTSVDAPIERLVEMINQRLGGVEGVTDLGSRYEGAIIVKIESCQKHENADKLNVCMIDDGSGELTQVVCGAPNVRQGMFVVWLKPGSTVPSTADDVEPFVLGARELRGVMSNGMLASPKELGLGDHHDGILEIDPAEWKPSDAEIKPGASFAQVYGLNDTLIDIENKMFTHRPDLFGQLGVAREIAGIQHNQFESPDWYADATVDSAQPATGLELAVFNEAREKVPRFVAVALSGVTVKPSPVWLQVELVRMGGKPINNVVDATNYVMLLTAQPTHAYDYDKLRGSTLGSRMANDAEQLKLLNGKTYELSSDDIVIVDGEGPVGLAGVMGGGDSEVSADTTNVVLEVANFDMYTVRKTSMRHGVFTDALTRFNKGQSPLQNAVVLHKLIRLITDTTGGAVASEIHDLHGELEAERRLSITPQFINKRLGLSLGKSEIESLLANVEFTICDSCDNMEHGDDVIHYGIPFWRTDIELPEDIVEEVGRLYGFDRLPRELPQRSIKPTSQSDAVVLKRIVRNTLASGGANEVLTYSFVHEKLLQKANQNASEAFKLSNALSPELQYYRYSPLVSILDKVHPNIKAGYGTFALFEIGKGHSLAALHEDDSSLPAEPTYVEAVYASKKPLDGAPFYQAKRLVTHLMETLGIDITYAPLETMTQPYDVQRSAAIHAETGEYLGIVGELDAAVLKSFKLPVYSACFTIDFDALVATYAQIENRYRPLSKYPSVSQDISLKVDSSVAYVDIYKVATGAIGELDDAYEIALAPVSIYQADDETSKTITLRLVVTHSQQTLTDSMVRPIVEAIASRAATAHDAVMV